MFSFKLSLNFTSTKKSTKLNLEAEADLDTQDDSSLKGKIGLITDCLLLVTEFIFFIGIPLFEKVAQMGIII